MLAVNNSYRYNTIRVFHSPLDAVPGKATEATVCTNCRVLMGEMGSSFLPTPMRNTEKLSFDFCQKNSALQSNLFIRKCQHTVRYKIHFVNVFICYIQSLSSLLYPAASCAECKQISDLHPQRKQTTEKLRSNLWLVHFERQAASFGAGQRQAV